MERRRKTAASKATEKSKSSVENFAARGRKSPRNTLHKSVLQTMKRQESEKRERIEEK